MIDVNSFSGAASTKKEYPLLPPNLYQFEILDIEQRMEKAYESDELEPRLNFTFVLIQEGQNYGRRLWKSVPIKLVGGSKQSGLYQIIAAVNKGEGLSKEACSEYIKDKNKLAEFLNTLVGAQLRMVVSSKPKQDGTMKNVIDSMLPIEAELPAFDESKIKKDE